MLLLKFCFKACESRRLLCIVPLPWAQIVNPSPRPGMGQDSTFLQLPKTWGIFHLRTKFDQPLLTLVLWPKHETVGWAEVISIFPNRNLQHIGGAHQACWEIPATSEFSFDKDFQTNCQQRFQIDCTWIIRSEENKKIYVKFDEYELNVRF